MGTRAQLTCNPIEKCGQLQYYHSKMVSMMIMMLFHFQGVANEVYNTPTPAEHVELRASTPSVSTPKLNKCEAVEDDEPPLNEDDDEDDLDDFDLGEEEPNTHHLVPAQFDKVTRTKSRWKCTLKDAIMHINTRDVLFNKRPHALRTYRNGNSLELYS